MLARVRLGGVGTILALVVALAYGSGQADWRVMVPVFATYGVGAALLAASVRRSDRAAIRAGFAVALLDVPLVFVTVLSRINAQARLDPRARDVLQHVLTWGGGRGIA